MSFVESLIFPAPRPSYSVHSFPNELLWIPFGLDYKADGASDCLPAVLLQSPGARYFVIYFHSNGEDLGMCYNFGCGLRHSLEVHVLLVEYPGYGICPGRSSEASLRRVATTAYRWVTEVLGWPGDDVLLLGRSLGSALATRLASECDCRGLVVVAPFLSLADAISEYVGSTLAPLLVSSAAFDNRAMIGKVSASTLVIHGEVDRLVPCSQGKALFDLVPHDQKQFVCPPLMEHNSDLLSSVDFIVGPMTTFFSLPDYSFFAELKVPVEAFDRRQSPGYHVLVESLKHDGPLARPLGDEEPCPEHGVSQGPHVAAGGACFQASDGDVDNLDELTEFTVRDMPPGPDHAREDTRRPDTEKSSATTETSSTHMPSSASRASEAPSQDEAPMPLGFEMLDIDGGISRFLNEL